MVTKKSKTMVWLHNSVERIRREKKSNRQKLA